MPSELQEMIFFNGKWWFTYIFLLRQSFKWKARVESCWQKDSRIDHSGPFTQNAWRCSSAQWQNKPSKKENLDPSRRESPPDSGRPQAGMAVVTLKHSSCRETSHRAERGANRMRWNARGLPRGMCGKSGVLVESPVGVTPGQKTRWRTDREVLLEPWTDKEHGQRSPGMWNVQLNLKASSGPRVYIL